MIIGSVVIALYTVCTLLTVVDETWNINNPRPNPKKVYYFMQWEKKDFYNNKINNEWVLRKYRKTDNNLKRKARNKYWEKRNEQK